MANAVYPLAKKHFMDSDIDMLVDDIVVLIPTVQRMKTSLT